MLSFNTWNITSRLLLGLSISQVQIKSFWFNLLLLRLFYLLYRFFRILFRFFIIFILDFQLSLWVLMLFFLLIIQQMVRICCGLIIFWLLILLAFIKIKFLRFRLTFILIIIFLRNLHLLMVGLFFRNLVLNMDNVVFLSFRFMKFSSSILRIFFFSTLFFPNSIPLALLALCFCLMLISSVILFLWLS